MSFPQGHNVKPLEIDTEFPLQTVPAPQTVIAEILNEARLVQEPFFASDIAPQNLLVGEAVSFFITVAITGSATKLQVTLDGQVNWLDINQGNTLQSGALFLFIIPVAESDLFNIRASKAVTVNIARIGQFVET